MPNRADHSVKIDRRQKDEAVKVYVTLAGTFLAVLGALAAMFAGGLVGLAVGAGVLTTIIILQIFSRPRRVARPATPRALAPDRLDVSSSDTDLATVPILILNVSQLGRVRAVFGRRDWLPGVRVGAELDQLLAPDATQFVPMTDANAAPVSVLRAKTSDGDMVVFVPETSADAAAKQAVLDRTQFFAGLGHDLKSPLNAVIGFADIMDSEIRGPMPEAYKDYPGLIRESGAALLRLIEDMLAYAKSETGTYELDIGVMDIAASGESVLRQSQAMADQAGVTLRLTAKQEVLALADANAVRRIWDNLVSNAIKYSPRGSVVTLSAMLHKGQTLLRVRDEGDGMDADDLARIAAPFAQGANAKGRAGTGLGLAMVQRLAELQGGKVEIRTAPGVGTTVTVSLPAARQSERRAAE